MNAQQPPDQSTGDKQWRDYLEERRGQVEHFTWAVPGLAVAGQAFPLSIVLRPEVTSLARLIAALAGVVAAVATFHLYAKQIYLFDLYEGAIEAERQRLGQRGLQLDGPADGLSCQYVLRAATVVVRAPLASPTNREAANRHHLAVGTRCVHRHRRSPAGLFDRGAGRRRSRLAWLTSPTHQRLARPLEPSTVNELGQRARGGFRPATCQAGKARKHGLCLLESDVRQVAAVAGMPSERRPPELPRLIDQEQDELERVRQAHEFELGRRRKGDRRVPGIECAAKATIGCALGRHEQMFAHQRGSKTPPVKTKRGLALAATRGRASVAIRRP
jgi:hypothetical protein